MAATKKSFAIVLKSLLLQEAHKLVSMLSPDFGRITAIARNAARSRKRFGAALEPFTLVKAELRAPRNIDSGGASVLWHLDSVEAVDSFSHLRQSYAGLQAASQGLRLVLDLIPEGASDPHLFRALGRFLRDSQIVHSEGKLYEWCFMAFWNWYSSHSGYALIDKELSSLLSARTDGLDTGMAEVLAAWHQTCSNPEAEFAKLFGLFATQSMPSIGLSQRQDSYRRWLDISGVQWSYYEKTVLST